MTFHTTLRVVCLSGAGALCACDDGPTEVEKSIHLSVSASSVAIAQGGTHTLIVTVDRTNFGGPVTLTPSATTGVSVSMSPAVLGKDATTSVIGMTVSRTAPPATIPIKVSARGEGVDADSITFDLTINVTGTYTLDVLDKPLVIAQNGGGSTAILVNRVDEYGGVIEFSVGTLPTGITATWKTDPAEQNSGNLSLAANGSAPIGSHEIVVTGTAVGLPDKSTTVTVNLIPPPATMSVTVNFCPEFRPRFAAYKNEGHPWQVVVPNGNSVTFNATARVGFVTTFDYTFLWPTDVYYVTREELQQPTFYDSKCEGTKSLVGQVGNVPPPQFARVRAAFAQKDSATDVSPNFVLTSLPSGPIDLFAVRGTWNSSFVPDKIIVRSVDLPDGSTIPPLDFASQGAPPVSMNLTLTGTPAVGQRLASMSLVAGMSELIMHDDVAIPASGQVSLLAAPSSELGTNALNQLIAWNQRGNDRDGSAFVYFKYFRDPSDVVVDVGREMPAVTVSVISRRPYSRMRMSMPSQPEYPAGAAAVFNAGEVWVTVTAGYLGGTPSVWDIAMPDLAGLPGFQSGYMLGASVSSYQAITITEPLSMYWNGEQVSAGDVWRYSTRYGPVVLGPEALNLSAEPSTLDRRVIRLPRRR
jgi:hypothetical protein